MNDGRLFAMPSPDRSAANEREVSSGFADDAGAPSAPSARDLIAAAAADRKRGASVVTSYAAEGLARLALEQPDPVEFGPAFLRAARTLLVNQIVMAPMWNLVNACLLNADAAQGPEFAADAVLDTCKSFKLKQGRARTAIARELGTLMPKRATVVTASASSTLEAAFVSLAEEGHIRTLYCTRSLPGGEGVEFVQRMRARQIRAHVIDDTAVAPAVEAADFAVIGADAIAGDWIVNKIGSRPLALCATELGLPAVVAAETTKMISSPITEALFGHLETDPQTARFEAVPWRELEGWVSETGFLDSRSVEIIADHVELHPRIEDLARDLISSLEVHTGYTDPHALTREQLDRAFASVDPERPIEDLLNDDLQGGLET